MIADALDAFAQIFSPPFRRVMWKSLGLTAAILVARRRRARPAGAVLRPCRARAGSARSSRSSSRSASIVGMVFLAAPTSVAGRELLSRRHRRDRRARRSTRTARPAGRCRSGRRSLMGLRFAVLSLLVNIVVLALTLFTGVGLAVVLRPQRLSARPRVFRARGDASHVSRAEAPTSSPRHMAGRFLAGVIVAGLRRRPGPQPADAPVRHGVHDARLQAPRLSRNANGRVIDHDRARGFRPHCQRAEFRLIHIV